MIEIAYNSTDDPPKPKIKNNQTMLLIIHNSKEAMISFLINHMLLVSNFEGHITSIDLLDAMFAVPGLIDIYINIII